MARTLQIASVCCKQARGAKLFASAKVRRMQIEYHYFVCRFVESITDKYMTTALQSCISNSYISNKFKKIIFVIQNNLVMLLSIKFFSILLKTATN